VYCDYGDSPGMRLAGNLIVALSCAAYVQLGWSGSGPACHAQKQSSVDTAAARLKLEKDRLSGIVALSVLVVKDLLMDFANRQRLEGKSPYDAVVLAAQSRFQDILFTSLTTFGDLFARFLVSSLYLIIENLRPGRVRKLSAHGHTGHCCETAWEAEQ